MTLRWSHQVLYVHDLEAMLDFYGSVLGFEVADRGPLTPAPDSPEVVFLTQVSSDHHQLGMVQAREEIGPSNSVDHTAFRVDTLGEVRDFREKLEADGRAEGIMPITHGNAWSVYFKDPEGNGIEIFVDSPWHVQQPVISGWDPAKSDAEVHAETERTFAESPEFQPMDEYKAKRAKHFGEG